ncbi:MAG: CoA-binding protein [Candidatus Spechtbacterales bacterium]
MSILINNNTRLLVQGITGKEGSRAATEMLKYGTAVVAGVTPGKGGQEVEGVPVYDSVREAMEEHEGINASLVAVPAQFARSATLEAIEAGIPLIDILTEKIPVADVAELIAHARKANVRLVGPSSVGIIAPAHTVKVGSIGSSEQVHSIFTPGNVGVVSKSGGMTAEISRVLSEAGFGQSTVVGIGGDMLVGSDFVDIAALFEADEETKVIVVFGELGGTYENALAQAIAQGKIRKPVVALIAGVFAETLPQDTVLGHAGAIVSGNQESARAKMDILSKAGAKVAGSVDEVPQLLQTTLS